MLMLTLKPVRKPVRRVSDWDEAAEVAPDFEADQRVSC
jgi:hypothetical protein